VKHALKCLGHEKHPVIREVETGQFALNFDFLEKTTQELNIFETPEELKYEELKQDSGQVDALNHLRAPFIIRAAIA
jgi:hypothetical protein